MLPLIMMATAQACLLWGRRGNSGGLLSTHAADSRFQGPGWALSNGLQLAVSVPTFTWTGPAGQQSGLDHILTCHRRSCNDAPSLPCVCHTQFAAPRTRPHGASVGILGFTSWVPARIPVQDQGL